MKEEEEDGALAELRGCSLQRTQWWYLAGCELVAQGAARELPLLTVGDDAMSADG